jgi:hypothetical protein
LIQALDDPCEPMRWWAAQGCAMLREKAAPAEGALRRHLEDASGAVQAAAAEALARQGRTEAALPVLERLLKDAKAPWAGVHAGNVLDRLGERSRLARPALRERLERLKDEDGLSNPLGYQRRLLERILAVMDGKAEALVHPAGTEGR